MYEISSFEALLGMFVWVSEMLFYLIVQLSSQYFLQVTPLVEEAVEGSSSQRAKRLRIWLVRFSTELEHLEFCCIWAGCVQPHLIIISLYS